MASIDLITLNFSPDTLLLLNMILGIVMLGIAIDMKVQDFLTIFDLPRPVMVGLACQFVLLPALTFLLTRLIDPEPSIALGMILVAACPGGMISNFFTHYARGNTALSVCMSAISTLFAMLMTPLNLAFWGSLNPGTNAILTEVALRPTDLMLTIFLLLGLPLALGLYISHRHPLLAARAKRPMRIFSMAFFLLFVTGALAANWTHFMNYIHLVILLVFFHNALALSCGYGGARLTGLPPADRKAVALEVGIQNSGLGLMLIFDFFGGLGGMALITAWWGIWHIISGFTMATWWRRQVAIAEARPADG